MDIATIVGAIGGLALIVWGITGVSPLNAFVSGKSAMITFGGTFGATLVNFPLQQFLSMIKVAKNAIFSSPESPHGIIPTFVEMAQKAKREGILSLESEVEETDNKFLATGIQLAVDGYDLEAIEEILNTEIMLTHERHQSGSEIFAKMGYYAPAFGMIGTLIGLIAMLRQLDNPDMIGPGMAVALITTLYGAIAGNLIFLPMAAKLDNRSSHEIMVKQLILEGVLSISSGDNPRVVEQKLLAFLAPKERKSSFE